MATEREIVFKIRVEGADGMGRAFDRAKKAAEEASKERSKGAKKASDDEAKEAAKSAREQEKQSRETLRTKMMVWRQEQQERAKNEAAARKEAAASAREEAKLAAETAAMKKRFYEGERKEKEKADKESARNAAKTAREERKLAEETAAMKKRFYEGERKEKEKADKESARNAAKAAREEQQEKDKFLREGQRHAQERERAESAAAREAEANARKAEVLQDRSIHKYLAGASQGVSAITSLTRAGVLLWAANEDEAEKVLKTLAGFEAGAQFLHGTIEAIQMMVSMWEAAEAAAKAYQLAEAATGAASAAGGVARVAAGAAAGGTATAVAGGAAAGAAGTGGVLATLSGALASAMSAVGTAAGALLSPLAAIGAAFAAAAATTMSVGGDILEYFTGIKNRFSLSGAIEGAGSLLGLRYSGAEGVERNEKALKNNRSEYDRRLALHDLRAQESAAMREAERSFTFRGSSLESRQRDNRRYLLESRGRLDALKYASYGIRGDSAEAASARDSNTKEQGAEAERYKEILGTNLELQKEAATKEMTRLQETIRLTEAATDQAKRARAEAEKATMSAAERFAAMDGGERARTERAAAKVLGGGEITSRRELQALSAFADVPDIKRAIEAYALKTLGAGGVALQTLYDRNSERAQANVERAQANERLAGDSARANKNIKVESDISGKITLAIDDESFLESFNKMAREVALPAWKKSLENASLNAARQVQTRLAGQ